MTGRRVSLVEFKLLPFIGLDLGFDKWPILKVIIVGIIGGVLVALFVQIIMVKRLKRAITGSPRNCDF